jgi:hypothetical protein
LSVRSCLPLRGSPGIITRFPFEHVGLFSQASAYHQRFQGN